MVILSDTLYTKINISSMTTPIHFIIIMNTNWPSDFRFIAFSQGGHDLIDLGLKANLTQ